MICEGIPDAAGAGAATSQSGTPVYVSAGLGVAYTSQMPQEKRQRMPAAFLGHGSPMNALETNRFTNAWRAFGNSGRA